MTVINTGLLTKDARSEFLNRFRESDGTALYQKYATPIKSTKDSENYRWLGSVPPMREWGNGRLAQGLRSERYDVGNLKYEASIEVDRDEISDDQTGQIRIRIAELAQRAATHKDYMIAQLLINGATTGFHSYDGVTFFNAAHVSGASGNQDNKLAPAAVAPSNPTTAEFRLAFAQARAAMMNFKDDRGEPMTGMNATGLVCLVPWSMETTAREALNASVIASTTNVLQGAADVQGCAWLSTATTWYLLKTDGIICPFIFQDREPIEFTALAEGSDEEFMREKYIFGTRARYRLTFGYWQYAIQNIFA